MSKAFLVTGATGKQGGAVVNALLSATDISDITIFALTRSTESGSAKSLLSKAPEHIKLIEGNLDDCEAIFKKISLPISAVFCVTVPALGLRAKADTEEIQGKAFVDAAISHGVEHFVYTSVDRHGSDSDTQDTDVPHFITKAHVEKYLKEQSQMSWTILRPTAFMDNIIPGFAGKIFPTAWKVALSSTRKLQIISTEDIGWFGAQALLRPKDFAGRAISLAGDELTFSEANAIFKEKVGSELPTTYGFIVSGLLWAIKDVGVMFKFFEEVGYGADVIALRREHPGLQSFAAWSATCDFIEK